MSFRYVAGVVGKTVTPSGPYQNSTAPGVWSLAGQANFKAQGLWPTQGSIAPNQLFGWGSNSNGQLGLGNTTYYSSPVQIGALAPWQSVALGSGHTLAIKTNGTLWSWGNNSSGQMGIGNATSYSSPKQVGSLTTWSSVSCGSTFSFGITTSGALWAWGASQYGQLGTGSTAYVNNSPVQIGMLTTWAKISAGQAFTISVKTDGTLWSWGNNTNGQLGQNNTTVLSSPKQVGALTTWSTINCGWYHAIATKTDGTLWSWGRNTAGQLGLNVATYSYSSPMQVGALTTWLNSTGNYQSTVATKTNNSIWSWGNNTRGQLGIGNVTSYSSPKQIGSLTNWLTISSSYKAVLATKTDGTLWSWGQGTQGQLGLGNTTNYSSPKQVGILTTWIAVSCGKSQTSMAIKTT